MLEIIALIFLCKKNGELALRKGVPPKQWKLYTVLAWIAAEILGMVLAIAMFGSQNMLAIMGIGIFSAFGGYLITKYTLENKPDYFDDDIEKIGVDDLSPPSKKL